jgi:hypothetical protein
LIIKRIPAGPRQGRDKVWGCAGTAKAIAHHRRLQAERMPTLAEGGHHIIALFNHARQGGDAVLELAAVLELYWRLHVSHACACTALSVQAHSPGMRACVCPSARVCAHACARVRVRHSHSTPHAHPPPLLQYRKVCTWSMDETFINWAPMIITRRRRRRGLC